MRRLLVLVLGLTVFSAVNADPYLGLPKLPIPADKPQTVDKIDLGRQLFNDKRLSIDSSVSCASCHQAEKAFADGLPLARGVADQIGVRNTPSLMNAAFYQTQFLDGRAASLEEQALGPLVNSREHGLQNQQAILEIVLRDFDYVKQLSKVFAIQPDEIKIDHIGQALASFERTLIAGDSAFDRYYFAMNQTVLSESAIRGSRLFRRKGNCANCHEISLSNALFTDNRFYNIGVGFKRLAPVIAEWRMAIERGEQPDLSVWTDAQRAELGRYAVTQLPVDIGKFKTPTLRNIALTAPYMHDGSLKTLEEVVEHYDRGEINTPFADAKVMPLGLTPQEKADLVAFLESLTSMVLMQSK